MLSPMPTSQTGSGRAPCAAVPAGVADERVGVAATLGAEGEPISGAAAGAALGASGISVLTALPRLDRLREATDPELLELLRQTDRAVREANAARAQVAGEIKRRSPVSAGHSGLAARLGERSPEKLIQRLTGVVAGEARQLTATGVLLNATTTDADVTPWLAPVADAVANGELSVGAAAAVAGGLADPIDGVSADELAVAMAELVEFARIATPEETATRARAVRDELDADGVLDREKARRARRSMTWKTMPDGTVRNVNTFDPESWAIVHAVIEAGTEVAAAKTEVRFMSQAEREAEAMRVAAGLADDGAGVRSIDQVRLDVLVDTVQLAARAAGSELDPMRIFGDRSTGVRVHVRAEDLAAGTGAGYVEGQKAAVSIETVTRLICTSGILPVLFDGLTPIDAGHTNRLHSNRQRIALAAAWGGCAWSGCDQPEHACEIHHREAWNGSNTTLEIGIPFCRFHHVELHTNGWSLSRDPDGTIWLIPPPTQPTIPRRPLRSKSPLHRVA